MPSWGSEKACCRGWLLSQILENQQKSYKPEKEKRKFHVGQQYMEKHGNGKKYDTLRANRLSGRWKKF